ncbi:MAG: hypothetical protein Q4F47_03875 [Bacteroidaceae bacterium]|nr:hypothetical protein [Bacteroidaceae bacterium]MDO5482159.1 hypothetical protein [Bacteroidaceae bacterium]
MKPLSSKGKILAGIVLLICGISWMLLPLYLQMDIHPTLRHAIIVFGAVNVLLSFPLLIPKHK